MPRKPLCIGKSREGKEREERGEKREGKEIEGEREKKKGKRKRREGEEKERGKRKRREGKKDKRGRKRKGKNTCRPLPGAPARMYYSGHTLGKREG